MAINFRNVFIEFKTSIKILELYVDLKLK